MTTTPRGLRAGGKSLWASITVAHPDLDAPQLVQLEEACRAKDRLDQLDRVLRGSVGSRQALIELPADGCSLPVPEMPSGRDWSESETARWAELWQSPQANQWDETARGTVAALLIYETAILNSSASAWQAQEARYAAESLGLTPRSLTSLGWRIVDDRPT